MRSRCSSASPSPDQAPQAMVCAGSPSARRCPASWSRKALAAAWLACPGLPRTPATLENRTNMSRSRAMVARCRCHAPSTFGPSTSSNRSQFWFVSAASDSTPTLWMTPASGGSVASMRSNIRSTAAASVTSAISTCTVTPRSRSASIASATSGSGGRRPFSTMAPAPRSASQPASAHPMPPSPPVTRYVLSSRRCPLTVGGMVSTIFPMCLADCMNCIAAPASSSDHRAWVSGASSPSATRAITALSAFPGVAGSRVFRSSSSRME